MGNADDGKDARKAKRITVPVASEDWKEQRGNRFGSKPERYRYAGGNSGEIDRRKLVGIRELEDRSVT